MWYVEEEGVGFNECGMWRRTEGGLTMWVCGGGGKGFNKVVCGGGGRGV